MSDSVNPPSADHSETGPEEVKLSRRVFRQCTQKLERSESTTLETRHNLYTEATFSIIDMSEIINWLRADAQSREELLMTIMEDQAEHIHALFGNGEDIAKTCQAFAQNAKTAHTQEYRLREMVYGVDEDDNEIPGRKEEIRAERDRLIASVVATIDMLGTRLSQMIEKREIEAEVAKLFLAQIKANDHKMSKPLYRILVSNEEKVTPAVYGKVNEEYQDTVKEAAKEDEAKEKIVHFDSKKGMCRFNCGEKETPTLYRIYIAPRMSGSPAEVVKILRSALEETGCGKTHVKMTTKLELRNDLITIYLSEEEIETFEKAIQLFLEQCPRDLLSDENLPTGTAIAPGITFGAEPEALNQLATQEKGKFSFNSLIANTIFLAHSFAYSDNDDPTKPFKPADTEDKAAKYFEQILKIAGINPETMIPENIKGGTLPAWIQRLAEEAARE
jgi:hypothetical protein